MFDKLYGIMDWPLIEGVEYTDIDNPSDILGQHIIEDGVLIQTFIPDADKVEVKYQNKLYEMFKMDDAGFYAVIIKAHKKIDYKLVITRGDFKEVRYDAYSFFNELDEKELKKFTAGISYKAYEYMGAHKVKLSGVEGVRFCVWAPEAIRVSVVGDFNNWDGRINQMSRIENTDIYYAFVPELTEGNIYKYEIKKKGGENLLKTDPYAFEVEAIPGNASVVADIDSYAWKDAKWLAARENFKVDASPLSIYQFSLKDFADDSNDVKKLAKAIADYVVKMGYTHVEFMPIAKCCNDSNGYITDYLFAVDNKFGNCQDVMYIVDYLHQKNIGVILDWTPTSFGVSDESSMRYFDGSAVYESANVKRGVNPTTGAHMYNYARPEITDYLLTNAFMWIDKYHFDGFTIAHLPELLYHDYNRKIGQWEANIYGGTHNLEALEFVKHFNSIIHNRRKGVITIADDNSGMPTITGEVSEECLGFDLKYNHELSNELLDYLAIPSYSRTPHYNDLSMSMIYQYTDNFVAGFSYDEFVAGKSSLVSRMAGDIESRKFDNLKLALAYNFVHPGKKLMFAGQDLGTYDEWNSDSRINFEMLDNEKHENINKVVKALNKLYVSEPALYELDNSEEGFEWINNISARESILTFVRKGTKEDDLLLVVCNFDAVDRENYKIGVPKAGKYKEVFNTADTDFGGNGYVNSRLKQSKTDECDGREESVRLNVAGLSISVYKYSKADKKLVDNKAAKENAKTAETTKTAKATVKKAAEKKTATKSNATAKAEPKKAEVKVETKAEPKKAEAKVETKAEPKKAEVKEEPVKTEVKKTAAKKTTVKAEPKKVEAKVETVKKAEAKPVANEEPKKAEVKPVAKAEPKKAEAKVETKPEPKKAEVKVETKAEPKKAEAKVETKAEPKKAEVKVETKPESKKAEVKEEPVKKTAAKKTTVKAETKKVEAKVETAKKVEAKPVAKEESKKAEAKPAAKEEPKKAEAKVETKPEPKKAEVKAEPAKTEVKKTATKKTTAKEEPKKTTAKKTTTKKSAK